MYMSLKVRQVFWVCQTFELTYGRNSQHCWTNNVGSCVRLHVAKSTGSTTPNMSFVPWSLKHYATMLDPFAQLFIKLFQHCWNNARPFRMSLLGYIFPMRHCRSQNCWELLHPLAHPPMPVRTQQLPRLLAQSCWELLRPCARSLAPKSLSLSLRKVRTFSFKIQPAYYRPPLMRKQTLFPCSINRFSLIVNLANVYMCCNKIFSNKTKIKFSVIKPSVEGMSMIPTLQFRGATGYPTTVSSSTYTF